MISPAVLNSDCEVPAISGLPAAAEEPPAVLANNDKHVQLSAHNENDMATDGASIERLTTDVTDFHISNGAATESTTAETPSPCAEKVSAKTRPSTLGTHVDTTSTSITRHHMNHTEGNKLDVKPTSTAVTSTEPVGIYYPPRRPNIFRARAKHLRFPECDRNPIPSHAINKSEGFMEDVDDDLSFEGLEEFQSESKRKMAEKTKRFMGVVQQCEWRSRVEDLGTVQEIEE